MMIMKMLSIIVLSLTVLMKTPMTLIIILTSITCLFSNSTFELLNNAWIPLMIIMTVVGGLMILYVFIVCFSPNEKKSQTMFKVSSFIIIILISTKMESFKAKKKTNLFFSMYNYNWSSIMMMILIILICMILMMKSIYSKNKTIKSMK